MNSVKMSARTRAGLSAAAEGLLADPELITKVIAAPEKVPSADKIERYFKRHAKYMKKRRRERRKHSLS